MLRKTIIFLLGTLFALFAQAAPHFRYERYDTRVDIEKDATVTGVIEMSMLLLDEDGIKANGQQAFRYNSQFEKIDIEQAYTLKPDGKKIPVDRHKGYFDQPLPVAADAPMYTESRQISLIFPNLAVGDRIVYRVRKSQRPIFPHQVNLDVFYPKNNVYDKATLSITMPIDLPLSFDIVGLTEKPSRKHGQKITRFWEYSQNIQIEPEAMRVNVLTHEPHLFITSFRSYRALANAYEDRARDKHIVTAEIQNLAKQLTRGKIGTAEKARAIYNWVSQNIRYVGVYFGAGGVVPHPAADTLANRYGDCKDHATLLQTLLKAVGIESSTVLINTNAQYYPLKIPAAIAFNHAITYIPKLNLFVDSTLGFAPFGTLHQAEAGVPALITRTGELRTTPLSTFDKSFARYHNTVKYNKDGQAEVNVVAQYHGEASFYSRANTQNEPADRLLENLMRNYTLLGSGKVDPGNPGNLDKDHVIKLSLQLDDQLVVPGPAGTEMPSNYGFFVFSAFPSFILSERDSRKDEFRCTVTPITADYHITLPDQVQIVAIPQNIDIDAEGVHYRAIYTRNGQQIRMRREFSFSSPNSYCPPSDIQKLKPIMRKIIKDLKSQVIYQPR